MTEAVLIAGIAAMVPIVQAIAYRRTKHALIEVHEVQAKKLESIHQVVNSRLDTALQTIDELKETVRQLTAELAHARGKAS